MGEPRHGLLYLPSAVMQRKLAVMVFTMAQVTLMRAEVLYVEKKNNCIVM